RQMSERLVRAQQISQRREGPPLAAGWCRNALPHKTILQRTKRHALAQQRHYVAARLPHCVIALEKTAGFPLARVGTGGGGPGSAAKRNPAEHMTLFT